jgi:hypothetical protein
MTTNIQRRELIERLEKDNEECDRATITHG